MVRDGLFSFRCVCRLELERSGCVRRGPPAGAGAPPSGGRYGRARKGGPHRLDIGSTRVPPLGWARARSLPRALRARAPLLLDSAGCGLCKPKRARPSIIYTVSSYVIPGFGPTTKIQESEVCIGTVSHARIWRHRRSRIEAPPAIDITKTAALVCATIESCSDPNLLGLRQARAIPTRTWCRR